MSSRQTKLYEEFKKEKREEDARKAEHTIADITKGTYPPELYKVFNSLKVEDTKLMDMRQEYLKMDRNNIKERDLFRAKLAGQYHTVVELESEFQRLISYEERNYKEETI